MAEVVKVVEQFREKTRWFSCTIFNPIAGVRTASFDAETLPVDENCTPLGPTRRCCERDFMLNMCDAEGNPTPCMFDTTTIYDTDGNPHTVYAGSLYAAVADIVAAWGAQRMEAVEKKAEPPPERAEPLDARPTIDIRRSK